MFSIGTFFVASGFILAKEVMNFTTMFRRLNIRELVSNAPVYSSGSGMNFITCFYGPLVLELHAISVVGNSILSCMV